jgi:hypothetical protein
MKDRFSVRLFHADVKSRDGIRTDSILSADIDTSEEFVVVNGKTGYLFHIFLF